MLANITGGIRAHKDILPCNNHVCHSFIFDNDVSRTSAIVFPHDVGKIAIQTNNNSLWILMSVNPTYWESFNDANFIRCNSYTGTNFVINEGPLTSILEQIYIILDQLLT